jgi:hypothetical protein
MLYEWSDRMFKSERSREMKSKRKVLAVLVVAVVLLTALLPAVGLAEAPLTYVSGLECAYVDVPAVPVQHGQTLHFSGQVHQNLFFSDDPAVFPNGVNTAVLDMTINLVTGNAVVYAVASIQPDGVNGTWEGHGTFLVDTLTGGQQGHGVFHGTGDLAGQTLVLDVTGGNPADCPQAPNLMSAGIWSGLIAPAVP